MRVQPDQATPICRLCQKKSTSQIGSHIFNDELIRSAVSADGETKRGKELSFEITPGTGVDVYFGRNLKVEKIEEALGRGMTDQEVESNKEKANPYVRQFFLCKECEDRIERVESYFMRNVHDRLENGKMPLANKMNDLKIADFSDVNKSIVRLYVYSLFWRAAETNFQGFKLEENQKEHLRSILDENLDLDIRNVTRNVEGNGAKINSLPIIIHHLITTPNENTNFIYVDKSNRPYFVLINDIAFQLFFKEKWINSHINHFWGLDKFKKVKELVNLGNEGLKLGVVSEDFRKKVINTNLAQYMAHLVMKTIFEDYSDIHQKALHSKPTRENIAKVVAELTDENVPIGVRHTLGHKKEVFLKNIIENAKAMGIKIIE